MHVQLPARSKDGRSPTRPARAGGRPRRPIPRPGTTVAAGAVAPHASRGRGAGSQPAIAPSRAILLHTPAPFSTTGVDSPMASHPGRLRFDGDPLTAAGGDGHRDRGRFGGVGGHGPELPTLIG